MPYYAPPTLDLGLARATGSIAPPLPPMVRLESASGSGYQQLTQGIRPETETVINYQVRGDAFDTSQTGQYFQTEQVVNDPAGSYTVQTLSLDSGGGIGALVQVQTDEQGYFITDEERALIEEQNAQAIANQQSSYLAQAAGEYTEPVYDPPTYETASYYDPVSVYQPAGGYQAPETRAPIAQPEVQSLPQEQAPPSGCETRITHYFDADGNDFYFEEHDGGGGSWSGVG
jgi:hypothetical protein